MARIREYDLDTDLSANDYLLGNDGDRGTVITKRFSLPDLRTYFLEGTGVDIINTVPGRYIPTIGQSGDSIERSAIETVHAATASDIRLIVDGQTTGPQAFYAVSQNGQATLRFENFSAPYYLPDFVGNTISFTTTLSGETTNTGTITSYEGFVQEEDGTINDTFNIELTTPLLEATNLVTDLTVTGGTVIYINVNGNAQFGNRVDIGESISHEAELHVHGTVNFDEPGDGIVFGDGVDPDVLFTTDGNNLNVQGTGAVNIGSMSAFNVDSATTFGNSVTIDTDVSTNNTLNIVDSTGNIITTVGPGGVSSSTDGGVTTTPLADSISAGFAPNEGSPTATLSSITLGDTTYLIPSPTGSTAVFPGVNVDLAPSPTSFTIGTFFTGTVDINAATGVVSITTTGELVAANSYVTAADGNTFAITATNDTLLFTNNFNAGSVFFTEAAYTSDGTVLTQADSVYQITNVDDTNDEISYSLIPGDSFRVVTNRTEINSTLSLPGTLERSGGNNRFLFIDDATDVVSYGDLTVSGEFNSLTYELPDTSMGNVDSLEFTGNHNVDTNDPAAPIIDITGRFVFGGEFDDGTTDTILQSWRVYVLNPITSSKRLVLPATPTVGDSIKISNLSTVAVADGTETTSSQWSIGADGLGNAGVIMRQTTDLELDDPTAAFELYYTGGTAGWVINGIN